MSLSKDLISQFVKATKDTTTVKKESTVYGTVVKYNEKTYVKIDGSDLLTPAETLSSVEEGERVSIMIKDHTATITGNYTAPSASSIKVDGMDADLKANTADIKNLVAKNAEIENLVASKATIEDLRAANAEIDTLKSNYAEIETLVADKASIGDLKAVNADIKALKADKADIAHLEANYATIGSLNAVYADITRLKADKANITDLNATNAEIDNLKANKADVEYLDANFATINTLEANYATIKLLNSNVASINTALIDKANVNDLNAANANISNLQAGIADINTALIGKADISVLEAEYATIKQLDATNANVTSLQTETANINNALINKANVSDLNATNANVTNLQATKANVSDLNATNANVNTLTGDLADITTLVNGNLTSDNIQSMVITGDKFTVANGFIKNAMIDSINANKITTGTINTNNVSIQSNDGSMLLQGNLQQFKDKNGKVRIQIGKDAKGDFTFCLYDENGTGQLINQNGIQSSNAIKDGLIVDSKVADNANIAGSKLDIDSVVTEVNNGTTNIKGTKIYLDGQKQTLDVAFNNMSTKVSGNTSTINTHTTSINTMNGKVSRLISDTTITQEDGTTVSLKDAYNSTVDTVDSHTQKIGSLTTNLATANNNISSVQSKQTALEQNLNGFKTTVSETYTTKSEFNGLQVGGRNLWVIGDLTNGYESSGAIISSSNQHQIRQTLIPVNNSTKITYQVWNPNKKTNSSNSNRIAYFDSNKTWISSAGLPKLDGTAYQTAVYDIPSNTAYIRLAAICGDTNGLDSAIKIKFEFGNKATDWSPAPEDIDSSITEVNNKFVNYSTTSQMNSAINQKANEITSTVSNTYATKTTVTDLSNNLKNNYSTTSAMNSAINQKANEITSSVSETYATKTSVTDVSNNLKNNYSTTSAMNSAINQKANEITSTVSNTYATKSALNTVDGKFASYSTTSQMNSAINQKGDSILSTVSNTYATKSALNTVDGKFANYSTTSQMNSAINQKGDSILSTVSSNYTTKADFNNLTLGGTNLIANTAPQSTSGWSTYGGSSGSWALSLVDCSTAPYGKAIRATSDNAAGGGVHKQPIDYTKLIKNEYYTLSAWIRASKNCTANFANEYMSSSASINITTEWKYFSHSAKLTGSGNHSDIVYLTSKPENGMWIEVHSMKLEKGTKPSSWSPAPQDVDSAISTVDGKFASYSTTSQMNSAINQKANEITSSVSNTYATKSALNTVDGKFANYSTTSQMNSAINQKGDSILSTVSSNYTTKTDFNNLRIGATNLITKDDNNITKWTKVDSNSRISVTNDGKYDNTITYTNPASGWEVLYKAISVSSGTQYTISWDWKVYNDYPPYGNYKYGLEISTSKPTNAATANVIARYDYPNTATGWRRNSITFTPNVSTIYLVFNGGYINDGTGTYKFSANRFKLEVGNKHTQWSPAPQDVDNAISAVDGKFASYSTTSQMNSAINQKANEITSSVSNTYTTKTEFGNLRVGGANLVKNSKLFGSVISNPGGWQILNTGSEGYKKLFIETTDTNWEEIYISLYSAINSLKDKITISFDYTETKSGLLGVSFGVFTSTGRVKELDNTQANTLKVIGNPDGWKRVSYTIDPTSLLNQANATQYGVQFKKWPELTGSIQIKKVQVEIGTIATEWNPAPQDTEGSISSLTTRMSNAESKLTKDSLTTTIGSYYTTSNDVNGLITSKGYATTSQVTQTATDLTAKFGSSGGYNLLRNSIFTRNGEYWSIDSTYTTIDTSRTFNGHNSLKINSTGATSDVWRGPAQRFAENIPSGKTYTASLWYYVADKNTFNSEFRLELKGRKSGASGESGIADTMIAASNLVQGSWTKVTVTATTRESWEYLFIYPWVKRNGTIWITELQVEEGSVATLWSPHPYEVYDGITQINKDGIKVYHNNINGENYTHMAPSGFYIKNKGTDIFKVDNNGLYVKGNGEFTGKITSTSGSIGGFNISEYNIKGTNVGMGCSSGHDYAFWAGASTGGSAPFKVGHDGSLVATSATITGNVTVTGGSVPSTILTGTIDNARLNSTIVNGAANGSSAKSTLDSKANGWDSAKSTVDNNKTNWSNAYNRVVQWASGSVTGNTTINGGLIQTGTVTAKQLYLGDLTNYCNLREETASLYGFTSESSSWGTWYKLNNNQRDICISGNKVNDYGYYKCMGGESFRIKFEVKSNVKGSSTNGGSDSVYCGVNIGLYGKLGDGSIFYQIPSSGYVGNANSTEGHINVWTTLPANARSFGVFLQLSGWGNWSGTCYIKNVQVFRMSSGELIVDGSITADKIAANTITADKIAANAVTADKIEANAVTTDKIAANAITSNKLSADAITGKTITGGIINGTEINGSTINSDSFVGDVLAIDGAISAKSLQVQDIDSAKYPATLDGNVDLYVNSSSGNDDNEPDDGVRYKTIQGAIDAIPKFLNNKTVYITMETNSTEDVSMRGIVGGAIRIYMNGKTLYGTLRSYVCAASINVYGGTRSSTEGATGVIHPSVGISFGGRATSVGFEASQYAAIYNVKVFAPDNLPSDITNTDKVCVASQSGTGSVYCKNIQIVNAVIGFRSNNVGAMHVSSSSGVASKYGFQATTGGIITIANNAQAGGKTSSTNKSAGGQVLYDTNGPTFATGNQSTDGGTAPVAPTTKVLTIKSSYGDTYRSSVYKNWKKDGTVRQGDYGYGDCNGCWFFGSAFSEVKGATIKKVTITITRQRGGSSSAVGLVVKSHGHSSRPSGAPTFRTTAGTLSLAPGKSGPLVITNSTILNEIKSGVVKGFGIQTTYDSSHYAVCSGSVTVKIEYQE